MLTRLKRNGRVAACGAISGYNSSEPTRLAHYGEIIKNRLTVQGFIVIDYLPQFAQGIAALSSALKQGKIDLTDAETLVKAQFEEIPSVWGRLFVGGNKGKLVTQIAEMK
jgi:NADPH-dependent curcumin reductase CurA